MARPHLRVADVLGEHWQEYEQTHRLSAIQRKVAGHIMTCRTAQLGGHLYRCGECGREVPVYNSCLDRHCPTCQTIAKQQWIEKRRSELLPVRYFHLVFTLPHLLNALVLCNRKKLFGLLFDSVNEVIRLFAADPQWRLKGKPGFIAVLHTWSQLLLDHFHLHCIMPGGVWRDDEGRWVHSRKKFLFRKDSLAKAFRRIFIEGLEKLRRKGELRYEGRAARLAEEEAWSSLIAALKSTPWVVFPKAAARKPEKVLDYLGRYVRRVAITDNRITELKDGKVTFSYRDRADGNTQKECTISANEFIRRFMLHVLPENFHKIRFFGFLARNVKNRYLEKIRSYLNADPPAAPPEETAQERMLRLTGVDINRCPHCRKSALCCVGTIPRAPLLSAASSSRPP